MAATVEHDRLEEAKQQGVPWRAWGPYLSERQWGTVREDYSDSGDAWNYFTHDQARSRAYRWGEDGLAGISDDKQQLCFALALWNGADPILKERLFGLTNSEGNHGEDVKEYYYYYLDPTFLFVENETNDQREDLACKFYEHFLWIAGAMDRMGDHHDEMWDAEDGFFYDLLRLPDGTATRLKVRSMVGLLSLCASSVFPAETLEKLPKFRERAAWFTRNHPELTANIVAPGVPGAGDRHLLALLDETKLRQVLARLLDEDEFLSPYGVRSLSRVHREHPYRFEAGEREFRVDYLPAESDSGMFGGNSNWRGPIWFPTNALLVRALLNLHAYYGDDFTVECPTGSGVQATLFDAAMEIMRRSSAIFLRGADGRRPVFGGAETFQTDPHWRDYLLFYEYFHGDVGAGLGASHQTGWTGLVAPFIRMSATLTKEGVLAGETFRSLTYGLTGAEEGSG